MRRSRDRDDDNGRDESFRVNFKGVQARVNVPEDDYRVMIESFKYGTADSGFKKVDWHFKIMDGPMKGNVIWYTSSLQKQALWRLRQLLATAGVEVPEDELEIDKELVIGATLIVKVIYDEEYDNNKVVKFMVDSGPVKRGPGRPPKAAVEDDEEAPRRGPGRPRKVAAAEDDEEAPRRGRGRPRKEAPDDEDEEAPRRAKRRDDDDEEAPAPRRGRPARGRDDDEGEDDAPRRRKAASNAPDDDDEPPRRKRRPADEDEGEEAPRRRRAAADDDEPPARAKRRGNGEDDDEPAPKRRRARDDDDEPAPKGKGKALRVSADDVEDMTEAKLDALIDSHGLDIDLSEYTTLRKKQSAVVDSLEAAGLLRE